MTRAVLALALALAACDGADDPADVDPALVGVLVELHLADARAALDTVEARRPALADSLRRVALGAHGLDSAALEARLDALARTPALARATYDSVEVRLVRERQGPPAPAPDSLKPPPPAGF